MSDICGNQRECVAKAAVLPCSQCGESDVTLLVPSGKAGDVADARGPAGNAARWLPPTNVLSWHHVPGHAPGQVKRQSL